MPEKMPLEAVENEENLRLYASLVIRAQEEERKRLARELHDETIQELLLVCHRLQDIAAGTYGRLPEPARERLEGTRTLIERTMSEIRGFTQDLRPPILDDMGLVSALRWLTSRFAAEDRLDARLRVSGEERRLPPEKELALFRIAQEALNNVGKHADASDVTVMLDFRQGKLTMTISDNGSGFNSAVAVDSLPREGKLGLAGIKERVELLGGTYKIESVPRKGTVLKVEITA